MIPTTQQYSYRIDYKGFIGFHSSYTCFTLSYILARCLKHTTYILPSTAPDMVSLITEKYCYYMYANENKRKTNTAHENKSYKKKAIHTEGSCL